MKNELRIVENFIQLIGNTPLLKLNALFPESKAEIHAKLEICNPMSVKDRPALNMLKTALEEGDITDNTEIVEASSGNTAIAIASICATMGLRFKVFMSESCSIERQKILCAFGARVVLTPAEEHTKGARKRAMNYCNQHPNKRFFTNQHGNPNNGMAHEKSTGPELWDQLNGDIGAVILGLGTSGTFDGISRFMKRKNPKIKIIGFEPKSSPVYSGGKQGTHKLIGIGPGFITDNFKRSQENLDELMLVNDDDAYAMCRKIARKMGLLVGITSGAAAWVAQKVAEREEYRNKNIVCFFYDTGERYLSVEGLFLADSIEKMN